MASAQDMISRRLEDVPVEILLHICTFLTCFEVQDLSLALNQPVLLIERLRRLPHRAYFEMVLAVRKRTTLRKYQPVPFSDFNQQMLLKLNGTLCILKSSTYYNFGRKQYMGSLTMYPAHAPAEHVVLSNDASHAIHFERLGSLQSQSVFILESIRKMIASNTLINIRTGNIARFLSISIPTLDGETYIFEKPRRTTILRTLYDRIKVYRFKTSSHLALDGEVRFPRRCGFIETALESSATGLIYAISTVYPKRLNLSRIFVHQVNELTAEASTISLQALLQPYNQPIPVSDNVLWEAQLFERDADIFLRIQILDNSRHRALVELYNITEHQVIHQWSSPAIFPFAAQLRSVSIHYTRFTPFLTFIINRYLAKT